MIEDGHLVRVDVDKPTIPTDKNVRVGDSEEEVMKAYGSEIRSSPDRLDWMELRSAHAMLH